MLVVPGMLVRRSDMACLIRRRGDLTPETQNFKKEETNPAWAFAQLCSLGFGLVTVSHANLVGLIRIPRRFTHPSNATGERFLPHPPSALSRVSPSPGSRCSWPIFEALAYERETVGMNHDDLLAEQRSYYRARAPEYDEWWQRRGRFDRGEEQHLEWQRQVAVVDDALTSFGAKGSVLELVGGLSVSHGQPTVSPLWTVRLRFSHSTRNGWDAPM